jgi:hypothetical protein
VILGKVDMDYTEVIKEIFAASQAVRYAAVLDATGNPVAGGTRGGIKSLGTEEDDRRLAHDIVLVRHVREEWDQLFGKVRFSLSNRSRVNVISVYLNSETLVVTTEPDVSLLIVDRIRDTLRNHQIPIEM